MAGRRYEIQGVRRRRPPGLKMLLNRRAHESRVESYGSSRFALIPLVIPMLCSESAWS